MRKLTKKALSLVLCVMLIASAISCAFSVFAEDVVNSEPLNLDFSDGFNHWTGLPSAYSAENGVLTIGPDYPVGSSWQWLDTEKFNAPNGKIGGTIQLSFDVEFEDGLPSMDGNANQAGTLASTVGYKILDVYLIKIGRASCRERV